MTSNISLHFEVATPADAPQIAQLVQLAFRHLDPKWTGPDTALNRTFTMTPDRILSTINDPNAVFLMATTDTGTLVGAMATTKKTPEFARLAMLAVDPTLQTGGLGRRILAQTEKYAVKTWGM
jgi:predicted N-acetyltransferase YhbS